MPVGFRDEPHHQPLHEPDHQPGNRPATSQQPAQRQAAKPLPDSCGSQDDFPGCGESIVRRLVVFRSRHLFTSQKTFHVSVDLSKHRVQTSNFFLLSEEHLVHLLLIVLQMHDRFLHRQALLLQCGHLLRRV